jgi:hypothetical protein
MSRHSILMIAVLGFSCAAAYAGSAQDASSFQPYAVIYESKPTVSSVISQMSSVLPSFMKGKNEQILASLADDSDASLNEVVEQYQVARESRIRQRLEMRQRKLAQRREADWKKYEIEQMEALSAKQAPKVAEFKQRQDYQRREFYKNMEIRFRDQELDLQKKMTNLKSELDESTLLGMANIVLMRVDDVAGKRQVAELNLRKLQQQRASLIASFNARQIKQRDDFYAANEAEKQQRLLQLAERKRERMSQFALKDRARALSLYDEHAASVR